MKRYKFLLIITLVILLSIATVIWFYPPSNDFGEENPFWNGLKTFYSNFEASSIESIDDLPVNSRETALVSIPYLEFTQPDLERVKDYVSQGGTLVLLDDFGYGNDVLSYLDIDFRFTQYPLLDPLSNGQSEWYPRITDFAPIPVTDNIDSIVLNHAAGLTGGSEDQVIAWSSKFSFFDSDNNSNWDEWERKGPIAVAAALSLDKGYIVLVADPSILINSMEGRDNNHEFIENITRIQSPDPEIIVDQSHLPRTNLYSAKERLAITRSWLSSTPAVSVVVFAAVMVTLRPLWIKKDKALVL
jgi:hypothetical protein